LKGAQQTSKLSKYSERMVSYFKACELFLRANLSPETPGSQGYKLPC